MIFYFHLFDWQPHKIFVPERILYVLTLSGHHVSYFEIHQILWLKTYIDPNLSHCVAVTNCNRRYLICQTVKIHCDTKWNSNLISARIATTDWSAWVINFMCNTFFSQQCRWNRYIKYYNRVENSKILDYKYNLQENKI